MDIETITVDPQTIQKDQQLFQAYLNTYYAKTKDTTGHIKYGTAGFRSHADNLPHVSLRVGIFTGIIAKISNEKVLGIVMTASHNPSQDNGIKQSDFDGGMIRKELENQVSDFVIEQDLNKAIADLLLVVNKIEGFSLQNQGMVFLGRDTRQSGPLLSGLLEQGIKSVGSQVKDFGEVTTPIIHYLVRHFNLDQHNFSKESSTAEIVEAYHANFINAFNNFYRNLPTQYTKKQDETILLDCSNGVGSQHIGRFLENMKHLYNVKLINEGHLEFLNVDCGAEFVHKKQNYPRESKEALSSLDLSKTRCLAFDGDADRIVYYLPQEGLEHITLLDGDRIISLFALFFQTIFRDIQAQYEKVKNTGEFLLNVDLTQWEICMVQTPYANGSSTEYLKNVLKVSTKMSPNGVKNLHPRAHQHNIGIYCESNGHGTFVLQDDCLQLLKEMAEMGQIVSENTTNEDIKQLIRLINVAYSFATTQNQIMGDAMTNFLCIEQALAYLNLSVQDWLSIYTDKKCLNSTVEIRDRSKIKVSETEDQILSPANLQKQIDEIVSTIPGSRSFARPSGTEDIVRVYAEHVEREKVLEITKLVSDIIIANKEIN